MRCCPFSDKSHRVIKNGTFFRECDSRSIQRFYCKDCKRSFSTQTGKESFRQHSLRTNEPLKRLVVSGVSKRRCAELLKVNYKTVIRKIDFLSRRAEHLHARWLKEQSFSKVIFDDMETFEHTKCKPLSIPLAVEDGTRLILAFDVAKMPAKGHLAAIARKKYGYRRDERPKGWNQVLGTLKEVCDADCQVKSDDNPHYPKYLARFLPKATHKTSKGGRGCVVGYGELKRQGFDPLFSLNHTCAMLRDNIACLKRRTWTTTKKPEELKKLLTIYAWHHNCKLLARAN